MRKKPEIQTWKNLEAAFAGESMAYQKYLYFADIARKKGNEEVAKLFEDTAKHEIGHARGHLRFLYPEDEMSVEDVLKVAIEGEKFEYTEMYPGYEKQAIEDGDKYAQKEFSEQIEESKEHAQNFESKLKKISKVFSGLTKAEQQHCNQYEDALKKVQA